MRRTARVYRTPTQLRLTVMEAARARVCNRADRRDSRRFEVQAHSPEASEWAIGRFPKAHLAGTAAHSEEFVRATPRGRTATTDIRASDHPGAEEAHRADKQRRAGVVGAVAAVAVVVANIARSERKSS